MMAEKISWEEIKEACRKKKKVKAEVFISMSKEIIEFAFIKEIVLKPCAPGVLIPYVTLMDKSLHGTVQMLMRDIVEIIE